MIREAVRASSVLAAREVRVFAQGSYHNNTNVRAESDVDICVLCSNLLLPRYLSAGLTQDAVGLTDAADTFAAFKDDVGIALRSHFGAAAVTRGKKAFDVHANTSRVDADVVPALIGRDYFYRDDGSVGYLDGTAFKTDDGKQVRNWPEQHYLNGVAKNDRAKRRFKAMVRALKALRDEMRIAGTVEANAVPSFLIECLAWNCPDRLFGSEQYFDDVQAIVMHLWAETRPEGTASGWWEVNDLKRLFAESQPWTMAQAHAFLNAAWDYLDL